MAKSKKSQESASGRQTKKQIAIDRRQIKQNRIIYAVIGAFVLVVMLVLAIGLITEGLIKPSQAVAKVNGEQIRTDDFQDLLTYQRYNQHLNIVNMQGALRELDPAAEGNEFLVSFYEQQIQQLESQLALAPQTTLDEMIDGKLIQEKAAELGITVTDAEVTQTIDQDIRQAVAPPSQVPITDTEELPVPTPIPQEQLDEVYQNALISMGLSDDAFRPIVARRLLRQKVQEVAAQTRIEVGEDFAIVAQQVSTDTFTAANGGDLGWVAPEQLATRYGPEVDEAAFSADVGTVVVVQSGDMYYVISVVERDENGPLPDDIVYPLQAGALDTWLEQRKAQPSVVIERLLDIDQIPEDPFAAPVGF